MRATVIFTNIFLSLALSYRWFINEFPSFIQRDDNRFFVSQVTGNLYMAKAEPNDTGSYYCFTTINMDISTKSTFSKANQLTVLPDGIEALQLHHKYASDHIWCHHGPLENWLYANNVKIWNTYARKS